MSRNVLLNYKEQLESYVQEARNLFAHRGKEEQLVGVEEDIRKKLLLFRPSLMFYGVYNAGKSTLLNAIFGEERAKTGDIPVTAEVTEYEWNGYRIVDTPGINGPEQDYIISLHELDKHDVICFVIDNSESHDSKRVAEEAIKIILKGKPLITVINRKMESFSDEGDQRLDQAIRSQFHANLQREAVKHGIAQVDQHYCFVSVNAAKAFKGRIKDEPVLITNSGITALEIELLNQLKAMDGLRMLAAPTDQLIQSVKELASWLANQTDDQSERAALAYLKELGERQSQFRQSLQGKVRRRLAAAGDEVYQLAAVGNDPNVRLELMHEELQKLISNEFDQMSHMLQSDLASNEPVRIRLAGASFNIAALERMEGKASKLADLGGQSDDHSVLAGGLSSALKVLPMIVAPPPVKILLPVVITIVEQVVQLVSRNKQLELENERLRLQVEEANRNQQQLMQQRLLALQELHTQIRIGLYQAEEQIMGTIAEGITALFGPIEESLHASFQQAGKERRELERDMAEAKRLIDQLESFRATLVN
ncbi:hypothetical protein PCCS19_41950 [Paenibacillus sp. CCS19]|uniref:GTPase n=1 Tax=Paenibacillus sp. CCS19 TaxID=3158387 RepID=UPI002567C804|nr:GTPase [Paenibacillus cellulosilyticus]GMK41139.1 hypothetical protein PCCS19_41950 [Paenibacillus cellulosilyticus]